MAIWIDGLTDWSFALGLPRTLGGSDSRAAVRIKQRIREPLQALDPWYPLKGQKERIYTV